MEKGKGKEEKVISVFLNTEMSKMVVLLWV